MEMSEVLVAGTRCTVKSVSHQGRCRAPGDKDNTACSGCEIHLYHWKQLESIKDISVTDSLRTNCVMPLEKEDAL